VVLIVLIDSFFDSRKVFYLVIIIMHSTYPEAKQWFCWVRLFLIVWKNFQFLLFIFLMVIRKFMWNFI